MADFSGDASSAYLNVVFKSAELGGKAVESFAKFIKYIIEGKERKVEREHKRAMTQYYSSFDKKQLVSEYKGLTKFEKLKNECEKNGDTLIESTVTMSPKDIAELKSISKDFGFEFAVIDNPKYVTALNVAKDELKNLDTQAPDFEEKRSALEKRIDTLEHLRENKILAYKQSDTPKIEQAINRLNWLHDMSDTEKEIEAYQNKGIENLSEEERKNFEDAVKRYENLKKDEFDSFNLKASDGIKTNGVKVENGKAIFAESTSEFALELACNRDKINEPCYIVNRLEPSRYIEVATEERINDLNLPYRVTTFNPKVQLENGTVEAGKSCWRGATIKGENTSAYGNDIWEKNKSDLEEALTGRKDTKASVLIFTDKESLKAYQDKMVSETVKGRGNKELIDKADKLFVEASPVSYKQDLDGLINLLKGQMQEHGFALSDKQEVVNASGEAVDVLKISEEAKYHFENAKLTATEIADLEKLKGLQTAYRQTLTNMELANGKDKEGYASTLEDIQKESQETVKRLFASEDAKLIYSSARVGDDVTLANNKEETISETTREFTRGEEKARSNERTDMSKTGWAKSTEKINSTVQNVKTHIVERELA